MDRGVVARGDTRSQPPRLLSHNGNYYSGLKYKARVLKLAPGLMRTRLDLERSALSEGSTDDSSAATDEASTTSLFCFSIPFL
jgi:hypothetical protein